MNEIGFGGGCQWCTEAVFQSFQGVVEVSQGWIASNGGAAEFSEAVLVKFDQARISLETLIAIHLYSHSCTGDHSLRAKYRSAIYVFSAAQAALAQTQLIALQEEFSSPVITRVLPFAHFNLNSETYLNYYYRNPEKLFCQHFVTPKLNALREKFGRIMLAVNKFTS